MQQAVPMQQMPQELPLRGLHLPAEPGFWPLAPGWWVVITLIVLTLIWLAYVWQKRKALNTKIQALKSEFMQIKNAFDTHQNPTQLLADVSMYLRRYEKFICGAHQAVTQTGTAWTAHLNRLHPDQPFDAYADLLNQGQYLPKVEFEASGLMALVESHIEQGLRQKHPGGRHV